MSLNLITLFIRRAGGGAPGGFPSEAEPLAIISGAVWDSITAGRPEWDKTFVPQHIKFAQVDTYLTGGYSYDRTNFAGLTFSIPDMDMAHFNLDWEMYMRASISTAASDKGNITLRFYDSLDAIKLHIELRKVGNYAQRIYYGVSSGSNSSATSGDAVSYLIAGRITFTSTGFIWDSEGHTNDGAVDFTFAGTDMTDIVRMDSTGGSITKGSGASTANVTVQVNLIGGTLI